MRAFWLSALIIICQHACSQELIGQSKGAVRESLEALAGIKDSVSRQLTETDSSMILTTRNNTRSSTLVFSYAFNKKGICYQETVKANRADCMAPYLETVLLKKAFDWKKINEHQYISGFEKKMFLELPPDGEQSSFMIFRVEWNKAMYDVLRESSVNSVHE